MANMSVNRKPNSAQAFVLCIVSAALLISGYLQR
jgi:hypothetical protein